MLSTVLPSCVHSSHSRELKSFPTGIQFLFLPGYVLSVSRLCPVAVSDTSKSFLCFSDHRTEEKDHIPVFLFRLYCSRKLSSASEATSHVHRVPVELVGCVHGDFRPPCHEVPSQRSCPRKQSCPGYNSGHIRSDPLLPFQMEERLRSHVRIVHPISFRSAGLHSTEPHGSKTAPVHFPEEGSHS